MAEAGQANGAMVPNVGSSLLPHQNPTTIQLGPTPPLSDTQRSNLERFMRRDAIFVSAFEQQRQRQVALFHGKQLEFRQAAQAGADIFGPGYNPAYGNGSNIMNPGVAGNNVFQIVYPAQRRRARKSKEFTFPKATVEEQANKDDVLVPIRLEIDIDGLVLRDTFTWNLHGKERGLTMAQGSVLEHVAIQLAYRQVLFMLASTLESLITPEHFAEVLCEDLQFPAHQFAPLISRSIREQIQDYHLPVLSETEVPEPEPEQTPLEESRPPQELRILIKIDITVANTSLIDQFEWDISCPNNDPEHFAEVLAAELGLGGEFRTAIAHSIREQVQTHTKCLNLIGYSYDGSSVHDEDLRGSFLPKITNILREEDTVDQFTPVLEKLTDAEIDKLEKDRERDKRRKRRQTRGRRGVILPDREPSKTKRTLLHQGHTLEATDPLLDLQQYDPSLVNRMGPTTRRTTMALDHNAPMNSLAVPASSLAGQGTQLHHRITRKLRGSGPDMSIHHAGLPGAGNHPMSYSRDSLLGSRDKFSGGSREHHGHSPMRETTPVQSSREGE
ncbi:SWI/SNF chromatin-remodeling complex subunit [Mortierella sp. NVP85]|nr:SWI/SNF chromatin-remodeling complex subunit [Mortierella sp. NVP85]